MSKNFRKLVIQFNDIEKLFNFFKKVNNWEVSTTTIMGIDYIVFSGYNDKVIFPYPKNNKKILSSSNVMKQDEKMVEYDDKGISYNLPLKDDILYKLYKDLHKTYNSLFSEENKGAGEDYDDSVSISIGLSENDFI
ncbi:MULTISPECIES: hypothetical protein [Bacteria]|uniref:hypothetical protein n=1 Tax=Bacteria TaxID=2 RepID=UPI003F31391B